MKTEVMTIYKPAKGAHMTDAQAQRFGEFISKLTDKDGGVLPETLIEHRDNPAIADWFEHNKTKAAWHYWNVQAREMLRYVYRILELPNGEIAEVRAFHPITLNVIREPAKEPREVKIKFYRKIEDILTDSEMRIELVEQALKEFRYMRGKYQHLKELTAIFEAIDTS